MTNRESEASLRALTRWLATIVALAFVAALPATADTLTYTIAPTTTDEAGIALPASGPGALTSHRIEYGTCSLTGTELAFGAALGQQVLAMPTLTGSFTVAPGTYCVRAFASNVYGEGKPYPLGIVGTRPGDGGSIIVLRQSP